MNNAQELAELLQAPLQNLREAVASGSSSRINRAAKAYMHSIDNDSYYKDSHSFTAEQDVAIKLLYGHMSKEEICDGIGCQMKILMDRCYLLGVSPQEKEFNSSDFKAVVSCFEKGATLEQVEEAFGIKLNEKMLNTFNTDWDKVNKLQNPASQHENQGELSL